MNVMRNLNFIAVDCEIAYQTESDCELCSIGFAFVESGKLVDTKYFLVRPMYDRFQKECQNIHKITKEHVKNAPYFKDLWPTIKHYFENTTIVAHNAKSAELTYLSKILIKYNFEIPQFNYIDTLRIFNSRLEDICAELHINMEHHHNALDDAISCAKCIIEYPDIQTKDIYQLINNFGGRFDNSYVDKYRYYNRKFLRDIIGDVDKIPKNNFCTDKTIYLSGNFEDDNSLKDEIYDFIISSGGKKANHVTKKTSLVVVGARDYRCIGEKSGNIIKAEKYNILCITKDEFYTKLKDSISQ